MIRTQSISLFAQDGSTVIIAYVHREHCFAYDGVSAYLAQSQILICPKCTRTWAKLTFMDGLDQYHWPRAAFCNLCNIKHALCPVPGSIFVEEGWCIIDDALLAVLPAELLRREFELHLKAYS